jgi:hypothetical protein
LCSCVPLIRVIPHSNHADGIQEHVCHG